MIFINMVKRHTKFKKNQNEAKSNLIKQDVFHCREEFDMVGVTCIEGYE